MTELSKAERAFIKDALNSGAPKPFITSLVWMCRKMKVDPNYMELEELAQQLDSDILTGNAPRVVDRRSGS